MSGSQRCGEWPECCCGGTDSLGRAGQEDKEGELLFACGVFTATAKILQPPHKLTYVYINIYRKLKI